MRALRWSALWVILVASCDVGTIGTRARDGGGPDVAAADAAADRDLAEAAAAEGGPSEAGVPPDGSGDAPPGECGNGVVEPDEDCEQGPCCEQCRFKPSGTVCRTSAGECDVAESCPGTADTCPPDGYQPDGTTCLGGTCASGGCAGATGDLYVATTGDDDHPGTAAEPFQTIRRASQAALPGTIVHVAPGTYVGGFQTTASGTSSALIRYLAEVRWGAIIVPPASSTSATGWDNRGAWVVIDGFEVDGTNDPAGTKWTVGINVAGTGDSVRNCHVHHVANTVVANSNGGAGILLDSWYGYNDMHALANVVHHVGPATGGGSWYHGIYQTATGTIKNNLVFANAGGGIHCWHDDNHIDIANNTSFGNGSGYIIGGGDYVHTSGPCDYMTLTNNIAFDNTGIGFDEEGECGTHNTFSNNLSFQNGTDWRLMFSAHTNDVTADPGFVDYVRTGGGDYHLRGTSPAIDTGAPTYAPATDLDGTPRPRGAGYDIGAYEY